MPGRAVKQPNGLYSRFSTVVDDFTHMNYSREELWEVFRDEGGVDCANGKMERADKELERWEDELETINAIHGSEVEQRRRKYILEEES